MKAADCSYTYIGIVSQPMPLGDSDSVQSSRNASSISLEWLLQTGKTHKTSSMTRNTTRPNFNRTNQTNCSGEDRSALSEMMTGTLQLQRIYSCKS